MSNHSVLDDQLTEPDVEPFWLHELSELRHWFDCDFVAVDFERSVHGSDPSRVAMVSRCLDRIEDILDCETPTVVSIGDPLVACVLPISQDGEPQCIAVGVFVTRHTASDASLTKIAQLLDLNVSEAVDWISGQQVWTAYALTQTANALVAKQSAEMVAEEVQHLSLALQSAYEKISQAYEQINIFYMLSDRLREDQNHAKLCQDAHVWLRQALPVQSVAIYLTGSTTNGTAAAGPPLDSTWLACNTCPISKQEFEDFLDRYCSDLRDRPLVLNQNGLGLDTDAAAIDDVRQLVVTPISGYGVGFGWIAAINHDENKELGSIEANLVHSVGAILGIHCANQVQRPG